MAARTAALRLADMVEAIERIGQAVEGMSLEDFEKSWDKRWLVERGIEIVSEASRHLTHDVKARRPSIPWAKVAGIGNILRHDYDRIAPDVLWKLVKTDLPALQSVCREELKATISQETPGRETLGQETLGQEMPGDQPIRTS